MNAWNEGEGNGISVSGVGNANPGNLSGRKSNEIQDNYLIAIGSRSARLRRKYKEKIIIVVLLVVLFILLIVVIIISVYYSIEKRNQVCQSRECVRSAANLLLSMDQSVDPCDDFFAYACGNWAEDHPKPDFSLSYDWFSDKQKKVERHIRDILAENATHFDPVPVVQAKEMYTACMDLDTLDKLKMRPVLDFMKRVNLPPLPTTLNLTSIGFKNVSNYTFDWLDVVVNIKKKMGFDILIGFEIFPDFKNATLKRLVFGQPSSADLLPGYKDIDKILKILKKNKRDKRKKSNEKKDEDTSSEEENNELEEYMVLYKDMMKEAIKSVIEDYDGKQYKNISQEKLDENIDNALQEYIDLNKLIYSRKEDNDTEVSNTTVTEDLGDDDIVYYTVDELQNITNMFMKNQSLKPIEVWKPYLFKIFNNTKVKLDFKKDVILTTDYDIDVLMTTLKNIQTVSPLNLELLIWMQLLENFIPHTTTKLKELYNRYIKKMTGIESYVPQSVYCSSTVTNMMGMAIGYAVANESFTTTTLPKVQRMLSNIKNAFESLVSTITWMDLTTKRVTVEKVRRMQSLIGFPEWLFVPGKLEEYYKGVKSDPGKHLENQVGLLELDFSTRVNNFRIPYKFTWETIPTEVNAYHTFQANAITIPLVMTQYPFYDLGLEALNYGALGTILGHELTHGFDNFGRQYDKDGTLVQWWTNSTINKYVNKTKCLVQQYSDFYVPEVDEYVNGNLTLGENIADNGGLRSSLRAYWLEKEKVKSLPGLTHLSPDQLFFLSYGNLWCSIRTEKSLSYDLRDEHSPSHLRLRGTLQNMPEFAKAWKCRRNTTMNPLPDKRCIIF